MVNDLVIVNKFMELYDHHLLEHFHPPKMTPCVYLKLILTLTYAFSGHSLRIEPFNMWSFVSRFFDLP